MHPFYLNGRSFAAPTTNPPVLPVRRTLFAPFLSLSDGSVHRLLLSNSLPIRTNARLQVFNASGGVIPVRWAGPHPQEDLIFQVGPFVSRFLEIYGADCANSWLAWVRIETTSAGITGYSLTSNPDDPGMTAYQQLSDGAETCVRLPFDCEHGKSTFCSVLNLSANAEEAREFMIGFYFANAPKGENLLVKIPAGHALSVGPELAKIRDHSGVMEIRAVDDAANFAASGFWRHPSGERGVLPTLPSTGSRV